MFSYLIRRLLYTIPIILGVLVLTFTLFFAVQKPETMARVALGKRQTPEAIQQWLHHRGYDKPQLINTRQGERWYDSIFFNKIGKLLKFDLGESDVSGRPLRDVFKEGAIPSVLITAPAFLFGIAVAVAIALYLVFVRDSKLDTIGTILCVAMLSTPAMVYIIFGQSFAAIGLRYFPVFGFELNGFSTIKFLMLPVALMIVIGLGYDVRLFRSIFLEEFAQDYVRTAFAKGLSGTRVLFVHVLKNGMIALITLTVAHIPQLILGSLLMESFFGIPGLGNLLYLSIQTGDFSSMIAFVYLGALLIQVGLIATDFCYALVDPRIRLS